MRKGRKNAGFTLLEILGVMAVIVILMGMGFVFAVSYQKNNLQMEYDAIAKEIFVAAQNHLTMADSQGLLHTLSDSEEATGVTWDGGESFCFVVNPGSSVEADSNLNMMLPFASIDENVRKGGSYIIRYQQSSARVLDVFYAQPGSGRFDYTFTDDQSEYENLLNNYRDQGVSRKSERQNYANGLYAGKIIGWYGGVGLEEGDPLEMPIISVNNGDILSVTVEYPGVLTSDVDLKLLVKGEESKAQKSYTLTGSSPYEVVLDDITDVHKRFSYQFSTASGFDLTGNFIPGENLSICAVASHSDSTGDDVYSVSVRTNSLFASSYATSESISGIATDVDRVTISSIRHLENLGSNVSGYKKTAGKPTMAFQKRDLSWTSFRKNIAKLHGTADAYVAAEALKVKVFRNAGSPTGYGLFAPINPLYQLIYSGSSNTLSQVLISEPTAASDQPAGLFGTLANSSQVSDLRIVDFSVRTAKGDAGALVGDATGVKFSRIIAYNSRMPEAAGVQSADDASQPVTNYLGITGTKAAGGLVGRMTRGSASMCAASVYVRSDDMAGGLVGYAAGAADSKILIEDSYSGGHTYEGDYQANDSAGDVGRINVIGNTASDGKAGGLVGVGSDTNLVNCYSTCSVLGKACGALSGNMSSPDSCYAIGAVFSRNGADIVFDGDIDERDEVAEDQRQAALPYDATLNPKYSYSTISQIKGITDTSTVPDFVSCHYGDWATDIGGIKLNVVNGPMLYASISVPKKAAKNTITLNVSTTTAISGATKTFVVRKSADDESCAPNVFVNKTGKKRVVYYVILDDVTTEGMRFADLFKDDEDPATDFAGFTPGDDITGVVAYIGSTEATVEGDRQIWSSIYGDPGDDGKVGTGTDALDFLINHEAQIRNFRHLENLDIDISRRGDEVKKAKQRCNLKWKKNDDTETAKGFVEDIRELKEEMCFAEGTYNKVSVYGGDPAIAAGNNGSVKIYNSGASSYRPVNMDLSGSSDFTYTASKSGGSSYKIENLYVKAPEITDFSGETVIPQNGEEYRGSLEIKKPDSDSRLDAGLFGFVYVKKDKSFKVKDLILENAEVVDATNGATLIGRVNTLTSKRDVANQQETLDCCYRHIVLDNVTSRGSLHVFSKELEENNKRYGRGYSGGLLGICNEADLQITNCHVYGYDAFVRIDVDDYNLSTTMGGASCGGLIASIQWCSFDIDRCSTSLYVYGEYCDCTGGFIGRFHIDANSDSNRGSTITRCYTGGRTSDGTYQEGVYRRNHPDTVASNVTGYNASGGFLGCGNSASQNVKVTITDCMSAASVYGKKASTARLGAFAGEYLGRNNTVTFKNNFTCGKIYVDAGYNTNYVGLFVGRLSSDNQNSVNKTASGNNYVLTGINKKITRLTGPTANNDNVTYVKEAVYNKNDPTGEGTTDFIKANHTNSTTVYDDTLSGNFPYCMPYENMPYRGDWEIPTYAEMEPFDMAWSVSNGDQLSVDMTIPYKALKNDNGWVSLMIKGEKSGVRYFAPMLVTRYGAGNTVSGGVIPKGSFENPVEVFEGFTLPANTYVISDIKNGTTGTNYKKKPGNDDTAILSVKLDDFTVEGGNFANRFPKFYPGENITVYAASGKVDLTRAENLMAADSFTVTETAADSRSVSADPDKKSTESKLAEGVLPKKCLAAAITVNSLFANDTDTSSTAADAEYTASIRFGRHLQNLDPYVSSINKVGNGAANQNGLVFTNAVQSKDIDWSTSFSDKVTYSIDKTALTKKGNYYGIFNIQLASYTGVDTDSPYKLDNFKIKSNSSEIGKAGYVATGMGENQTGDINKYFEKGNIGGFFRAIRTSMTIANLSFSNLDVKNENANQYAGGLIGRIDPTKTGKQNGDITVDIKNVSIDNLSVYAMHSAGGIVGYVAQNENNLSKKRIILIDGVRLSGSTSVYSKTNVAGGITGDVMQGDVTIKNADIGDNLSVRSNKVVGGILPAINGSLILEKVDIHDKVLIQSDTEYAGGIVGLFKSYDATLKADKVHIYGDDVVVYGSNNTGGFAGEVRNKTTVEIDSCSTSAYVYSGMGSAGGLVGYMYSDKTSYIKKTYVAGHKAENEEGVPVYLNDDALSLDGSGNAVVTTGGGYNVSVGGSGSKVSMGGFIGSNYNMNNMTITDCFSSASLGARSGIERFAGFLGGAQGGDKNNKIINSHCSGDMFISNGQTMTKVDGFTLSVLGNDSSGNKYVFKAADGDDPGYGVNLNKNGTKVVPATREELATRETEIIAAMEQ